MKTNKGLVEYAKAQLGKPYWYGSFGQLGTKEFYEQKKRQYPSYYQWSYKPIHATIKIHDCVGLVKAYLWCDSPTDSTPTYNGAQDKSANGMYAACSTKGAIGTLPEMPGALVFMNNHVGVYIGNGEVIEARGTNYGVVKTKLKDRPWKNWGLCPYITYEADSKPTTPAPTQATVKIEMPILKRGMKVAEVKTLQRLLTSFGYPLDIDGSFGPATDAALRKYQGDRGLAVDGSCGPATWNALLK